MTDDRTRLMVLREAVERADALASSQAQLIETQREVINLQRDRLRKMQSEMDEMRTLIARDRF